MLDKTGYVTPPSRRSRLAHRSPISSKDGGAKLAEQPFGGKLIVRGEAPQIVAPLTEQTGITLPTTPCTSASMEPCTALWLGPSEWMLLTAESEEKTLLATIKNTLDGIHHQLVDITDYYTMIRLSGAHSREMLAKLTTLDLHPRAFPEGAVKGSIFGRLPATLYRRPLENAEEASFELFIRRSHADYLWCLLALAGREYGLPEQQPEGRVKLAEPQ